MSWSMDEKSPAPRNAAPAWVLSIKGASRSLALPAGFGETFAAHLAETVSPQAFDVMPAAEKVAAEKYATRAWTERR